MVAVKRKKQSSSERDKNKIIAKAYYEPISAGSYSSVKKLSSSLSTKGTKKSFSKNELQDWLKDQSLYRQFKRPNSNFPRSRIRSPHKNYMWDADLMNMYSLAKYNKENKYVLVCIDIFSRYVYTELLKSKNAEDVVTAFKKIFHKAVCKVLRTDAGKEFTAKKVQKLFDENGVKHYVAYNEGKASYAERAIRTLKNKLVKYMIHKNSYRWYDVLQNITTSYNSTVHSSIGIEPNNVTRKNSQSVYKHQYERITRAALRGGRLRDIQWKRASNLKEGHYVHLLKVKNPFTKDYESKWTKEIFEVDKRSSRDGIPVYYIKDLQGEEVKGTFYRDQLQKAPSVDAGDFYEVEKVIKTRRTKKGEKEYFVKFKNYPLKFSQWVRAKDLKDI